MRFWKNSIFIFWLEERSNMQCRSYIIVRFDLNAVINDGLSDESRKQLSSKSGEQIVEEDIKGQMGGG